MSDAKPISADLMALLVRDVWNKEMGSELADMPEGASFEFVAPATGQRFRITVAEVPGWTEGMERDLAAIVKEANP